MLSSPHPDTLLETPATSTLSSKKAKTKSHLTFYRCMIVYRFLLAGIGGYVLASLTAIVIARLFQDYGSSAAVSATLIAFCLQTAIFIWVFMVHKTLKASLGVIVPTLLLYIIYRVLGS